jgi:hypothetical protein
MDKDNPLVLITPDDIAYLEGELTKSRKPATLRELAERLAFLKTANQRTQDVKIYDPSFVYEVGDSIYREYDEPLTVSSKTVEPFKGPVVLKVVKKIFYKAFNCEMLEVDYTGGGTFRKYVDYMKKSKAQVLLPSNADGANLAPPIMDPENDPRLTELPITDKDLKSLERNLRTALLKSPAFFTWSEYWQLVANQPAVADEKITEIENHIAATGESAATRELVKKLFGLEASHELFDLTCLGLNHVLETKYKKEFVQVSPLDWGKWHLKSVLSGMPENLPLAAAEAVLPELETAEKIEVAPFHEFPLKVYLSWREILSGGIKIPKSFNKELSHSREYTFTDADENKSTTVYYFPQQGYFLGLKDYFSANNIPQGTSLTLERKGPVQFSFWLKKSKKKTTVVKLAYDPSQDVFTDPSEVATLAEPNKIIYLEREVLAKLLPLVPQRDDLNLRELLVLVFKNFGAASAHFALHYLRAYHLADILKRTSQEDVEFVLLNSAEFEKSDKKKGIFYYRAPALPKEEVAIPAAEIPAAVPLAEPSLPEIGELEVPEEILLEAEIAPLAATPEKAKPAAGPKKEKPPKRKKVAAEGEKAPRARKSERRVIEERIEEEESEQEALYAEKAREEEEPRAAALPGSPEVGAETRLEAKKEEPKKEAGRPAAAQGSLFGNLFAEKLKSALTKKRREDQQKKSD